MTLTTVGPHKFERLRRFRNGGACRACYVHEGAHPVGGWTTARPLGDKRRPSVLLANGIDKQAKEDGAVRSCVDDALDRLYRAREINAVHGKRVKRG